MRTLREQCKKNRKNNSHKKCRRTRPHLLRLLKEWNEWIDIPGVFVEFPKGSPRPDLFKITITPENGYWRAGNFAFEFVIPENYPMEPPEVTCLTTPIYHPNIDIRGNICLNLLRSDWKPVNTFESVIYGLILLFEHPNFRDPLSSGNLPEGMEPFELMRRRGEQEFARVVNKTMEGGQINELGGVMFPTVIQST